MSRVYADAYQPYIPTNGTADTFGLVSLFGISPAIPPAIRINSVVASGTNLVMSGGGGAPGLVYSVLASSDASAAVSTWMPIATNTFDVSGNFVCTNAIDPAVPQRFYLLEIQ